ncbi:MAG TPA: SprT family zinc-dependent metalloprotease [Oligoflexia bacterium]|nr:SprT family zinc-dependent metalloprotease [Oligoflexia bacterium]HMR24825.1 SprT family zinc-dependent metalloprotease [Oligoflexia bacterium]
MFEQLKLNIFPKHQATDLNVSEAITYTLVRKKRKTVSLHVLPDQTVEVRAPLKMSRTFIDEFVAKHEQWIEQRKIQMAKHNYLYASQIDNGHEIPILGENYVLLMVPAIQTKIKLAQRQLIFYYSQRIGKKNQKLYFDKAMLELSETMFEPYIQHCFAHFKNFYTTAYPQWNIKNMKRQWGNYSKKQHRITLNTKLLHLPDICLKSVIYHELCHTQYFSHSPRFYLLLDRVMPNWRDADHYLKSLS